MEWAMVALTAFGLTATLVGEHRKLQTRYVSKPIASAGFVGLALVLGATDSAYGWWILAALIFGWVGDVALLGSSRSWFLTGLVAFLIGHLLYVVAFVVIELEPVATLAASVLAAVAGVAVFRWLRPHLPEEMVVPVIAYVVIISAMVSAAIGAAAAGATALIGLGAFAFYGSDLAVARDRFVAPGIVNRIWGLPLYYLGQILLAWSVA